MRVASLFVATSFLACRSSPAAHDTNKTPSQERAITQDSAKRTNPIPPQDTNSSTAARTASIMVSKAIVIANVAYTQQEVAADTNHDSGISEAIGDYDNYIDAIRDSLRAQNVQFEQTNVKVVRLQVGTVSYTFSFAGDTSIGCILAAPGRVPKLVVGVPSDVDLPPLVRKYLQ